MIGFLDYLFIFVIIKYKINFINYYNFITIWELCFFYLQNFGYWTMFEARQNIIIKKFNRAANESKVLSQSQSEKSFAAFFASVFWNLQKISCRFLKRFPLIYPLKTPQKANSRRSAHSTMILIHHYQSWSMETMEPVISIVSLVGLKGMFLSLWNG